MASSRRTYDTDVITLRTVFAKNVVNSNIPAQRVLTADGAGGTYWAIPSSLGENPAFNEIITSAGTYTADLSYNRFRLLAGEGIGMVNGPVGSNQTTLYSKAFSQVDVSGDNAFYAFTSNSVTPIIRVAATGSIQVRSDPGTNTLFIDGPKTAPYIVSTGIYGFNQLKVTPVASTITSSIINWGGDFITANSPSTLLRFVGVNDIQLSTNVTANSVFFTISSFNSRDYLNISTAAFTAYPNAISTVSSLYTSLELFNSTVNYLSTMDTASYSTLKSTIDGIAMSTGIQFYILTGLINARATIIQLNSEISNVNLNIQSTSIGLGTLGYISTGGGAPVGQEQLVSTVIGLGTTGYLSTAGAVEVIGNDLRSTVIGLGTSGYVSSLSTIITSSIFNTGAISTQSLEVYGSATLSSRGSTILRGPTVLQGPVVIQGAVSLGENTGLVSSSNLTSSMNSLASAGYVSTPSLVSSLVGLGSLNYISTTQLQSSVQGIYSGLQSTVGGLGQIYISTGGGAGNLVTANLTSTVGGLGQIYISTAGGGITSGNLVSTVGGLGQIYISTAGGGITTTNLVSTTSGINRSLISTVGGLGQIYISTAGGGISAANLTSTVAGLGTAGYLSTGGGGTGNITTANLNSSITGLGSANYISTASLVSTVAGIGFYQGSLIYDLVTPSTVRGLGTSGYVSSTQLASTVTGIQRSGFVSSPNLLNLVSTPNLLNLVSTPNLLELVSTPNLLNLVSTPNLLELVSTPNLLNLVSTPNLLELVSTPNLLGLVSTQNLLGLVSTQNLLGLVSTQNLLGLVSTQNLRGLVSTQNLLNLVSTQNLLNLVSTQNLLGLVSTPNLLNLVSTSALNFSLNSTVSGLATSGYVSTTQLVSTVVGIGAGGGGVITATSLNSTITGLATVGYISSLSLTSTVNSLVNRSGSVPFVSAFTVSTGSLNASTISFPYPSTTQFLWVVGNAGPTTSFSTLQYSGDTFNWSNCAGSLFTTAGYAVGYNNRNLWVAVGQDTTPSLSTIKYSRDGINWSNASGSVFRLSGTGVAYNGSQWLALGADNGASRSTIKYSSDGINWSNAAGSVFTGEGYAASWNGSFWVAVGCNNPIDNANIKYSGDGINWSNSGVAFNRGAFGVAWNGIRFVAVGYESLSALSPIKYSGDGLLWSNAVTPLGAVANFGFFGTNVTWNGSYFLAGGAEDGSNRVRQSADGITWTSSIVGSGYCRSLTWNGSLWIYGTSGQTPSMRYSGDAVNWSNVTNYAPNAAWRAAFSSNTPPSTQTIRVEPTSIVLNNTLRVNIETNRVGINTSNPLFDLDVGGAGRFQFVSTLALNFSSLNGDRLVTPINSTVIGLATSGYISTSQLVSTVAGIGSGGGGGSSGPINFLSAFTVSTGYMNVSTINNIVVNTRNPLNIFVAAGIGSGLTGNNIAYSYNGITWTNSGVTGQMNPWCWGLGFNGRFFVAVGQDTGGNTIKYSGNGINWSNITSGNFSGSGYGVVWNGRYWLALGNTSGNTGSIKVSFDSLVWQDATSGVFTGAVQNAAWNGYMWVAVGVNSASSNGTIRYSYNGFDWFPTQGSGFIGSSGGNQVAWSGRIWVAAGGGGAGNSPLKYSGDGINWSNSISGGNYDQNAGYSVIWTGKMFLSGGGSYGGGTIRYSIDGCNWFPTSGSFTTFSGNAPSAAAIVFNGSMYVAGGYAGGLNTAVLKYSYDGLNWLSATNNIYNEYMTNNGMAYSSNVLQTYRQDFMSFTQQNIPSYFFSTNQIMPQLSSLIINNALVVDGWWDRVGINCNLPQYDLDVNGFGYIQGVLASSLVASSITTSSLLTSSLLASNITTSSLQVNSLIIGTGTGWVNFGPLQTVAISSQQENTNLAFITTLSTIEHFGSRALISSLMIGQPTIVPSTTSFRLVLTNDSATKPLTTSWTVASDQRIKDNIVDANTDICYDTVKLLKLRRFEYTSSFSEETDPYDKRVLGFVAQEVSSILPKSVMIEPAFGYSNFFRLNVDQINFSLFGAVQRTINDKEHMESTIKGQRFEIETLRGTQTFILSTLEGLQGR